MKTQVKHWQDPVNALLGAWLVVSPWVLGFQSVTVAMVSTVAIGVLLVASSAGAMVLPAAWEEWLDALLGAALMVATVRYLASARHEREPLRRLRQDMGRGTLLGLEVLVAADIIRTVAVTPTLRGVLVLGIIVLIRTFLSIALEVEIEGKWPWHARVRPEDSGSVIAAGSKVGR